MLRKIRIVLAVLFLAGITLLFVGIGQDWWGWMAKLQLLPATLRIVGGATALNILVVLAILLLTFLLGRIYCSVICPMGVFQDVIIWIRRQAGLMIHRINARRVRKYAADKKAGKEVGELSTIKREVKHFEFNKEHKWVRYPILVLTVAAIIAGLQVLVSLIAPYSAYGRMVQSIVGIAEGHVVAPLLIVGLVTLVLMAVCAWLWGRAWCNTICPVGTLLGLVAKKPLLHIKIDESKCAACGRCGRGCKSSCIDMDAHTVDYSRCVDCFDCIDRCKEGAISFGFGQSKATEKPAAKEPAAEPAKNEGLGRREFLATASVLATAGITANAQDKRHDGGLAPIVAKQSPERSERLVPPGALSVKDFYDHCTACQLCVAACPNGVLRPSKDLEHLLQPQMGYENGFCRPECTECSSVCPAGAIRPISRDEKTAIHIGTAVVDKAACIGCAHCKVECPTGAIMMVKDEQSGNMVAAVAEEQCIGCGKCEYLCPVRPISAITVNGLKEHRYE